MQINITTPSGQQSEPTPESVRKRIHKCRHIHTKIMGANLHFRGRDLAVGPPRGMNAVK